MIIQTHDERVFDLAESIVELAGDIITNSMMSTTSLAVHLIVDAGIGSIRDEAH